VSETVGFIGLGEMGGPMSKRLQQAGYTVTGFDVDPARMAHVEAAASPADAAKRADRVVISIVRTLQQTEIVLFGGSGISAADRDDIDVVIMSTIDPGSMERIAKRAHFPVIDAPVSGGVQGAQAGTLTIMVAGKSEAIERTRPLLEAMGEKILVVGDRPGPGQAIKLANQLSLAVSVIGTLEALNLAKRAGVAPEEVLKVLEVSTGSSWPILNFETVRGWWELEDPDVGALGIILKDLGSIEKLASESRLDLPAAELALERLRNAWADAGLG